MMNAPAFTPAQNFGRLALRISSLGFFGFGIWAVLDPTAMMSFVDLPELPAAARVEVRAFYGGLEFGFGLFLLASARRPTWIEPAVTAAFLIFAGCATGRILAMIWDQAANFGLVGSALGEAAGAGLNLYALLSFKGVGLRGSPSGGRKSLPHSS